jgi:hypothetical protein
VVYVLGAICATLFALAMFFTFVVEIIRGPVVGTRVDALWGDLGVLAGIVLLAIPLVAPWVRWLRDRGATRGLLPLHFKEAKRFGYRFGVALICGGLLCVILLFVLWTLDVASVRKMDGADGLALFSGAIFLNVTGVLCVERSVWRWKKAANAA